MSDAFAVAVDCYAGSRGEETPRRFTFENQLVEIRTVVDQWRTPDHRYFKVRTAASESYTLRHDVKSGVWELTGVDVTPADTADSPQMFANRLRLEVNSRRSFRSFRYPGGSTSGDVQLIDQRSNRDLITGSVIATLSLVVVAGVAFVLLGSPTGTGGDTRASILPAVNALLNGTSAVLLTVGYVCIRRKKVLAHKTCMATAFVVSLLFLVSYLIHHYRVGAVPFAGEGWLRGLYFSVLIPHVVLAALVVPLALTTSHHGLTSRFDKHVRIARWTLPIWLYVSVSGVLVYWMLYWLG